MLVVYFVYNVKPLEALEVKREFIKIVHFSLNKHQVSERDAMGKRTGLVPTLIVSGALGSLG